MEQVWQLSLHEISHGLREGTWGPKRVLVFRDWTRKRFCRFARQFHCDSELLKQTMVRGSKWIHPRQTLLDL
jgi:hypothetical protein